MDDKIYLAEWRLYAGLTQQQLGLMLGITSAQISRVETGKRDYDGRYLKKFCAAINKALDNQSTTLPQSGLLRCKHHADPLHINPDPATALYDNPSVMQAVSLIADEAIKRHMRLAAEHQPERHI